MADERKNKIYAVTVEQGEDLLAYKLMRGPNRSAVRKFVTESFVKVELAEQEEIASFVEAGHKIENAWDDEPESAPGPEGDQQ